MSFMKLTKTKKELIQKQVLTLPLNNMDSSVSTSESSEKT